MGDKGKRRLIFCHGAECNFFLSLLFGLSGTDRVPLKTSGG
jgi:hypothetical protein